MVGLARAMADMLGSTGTVVSGFATSPTAPTSMQVSVASGDVLSLQNIDGTAFSDVPADVSHAILKQGIALDPTLLTLTAPATSGQSIVYLVEVGYQDVDTDNVVLPYYNAAAPAQPFTGPGGAGASQPTTRHGAAIVQAKAGIAATTGQQAAPAADSGFVGIFTVTVAAGQTAITSPNIAQVAGAPFLAGLLNAHHGGVAGQAPKINLAGEVAGVLPLANLPTSVQQAASGAGSVSAALQRDVVTLAIQLARLKAAGIQLPDGFDDTFGNVTGIDSSRSSGITTFTTTSPPYVKVGSPANTTTTAGAAMTSNTAPTGSVSATPVLQTASYEYYAFDQNGASIARPTGSSETFTRDLGTAASITGYAVTDGGGSDAGTVDHGWAPSGLVFSGSNDGSSWTQLDTQSLNWANSGTSGPDSNGNYKTRKVFNLASGASYRYYRWAFTGGTTATSAGIIELELLSSSSSSTTPGKLTSAQFIAAATPTQGSIWLVVKAAQVMNLNTDIVAKVSRNDGAAFANAPLTQVCTFSDGTVFLEGTGVDLTGQTSGTLTQMRYEIDTVGTYEIDVQAVVYRWS